MTLNIIDSERLIHSLKTAIASLIGYVLAKVLNFSSGGAWVIVTIIVLMTAQLYVGSVFQRSYMRFLGTVIGCCFALITLVWIGVDNVSAAITIALSTFAFSYIATAKENYNQLGTLGAATTAMIMMYPHPTLHTAIERFSEISLGILIAAITSQFVLPIHARTHLRRIQAQTFVQLRDHFIASLEASMAEPDSESLFPYEELDESLGRLLYKQRQLSKEAVREPLGIIYDPKIFIQCLYSEKGILRSIDFMHHALLNIRDCQRISESNAYQQFNQQVIHMFDVLIAALSNESKALEYALSLPSIVKLKAGIDQAITNPTPDELIYLDAFLFSAHTLVLAFEKLGEIYKLKIAEKSSGLA